MERRSARWTRLSKAEPGRIRQFFSRLGPGLVTGAADDDPSGIGTHSQVGAEFGYGLSWTFLFSFPLMVAIQEVAAEIGRVTGAGIARNLRRHYPSPVLFGIVALLLVANIINLGADLAAMGAAVTLLAGGPATLYTILIGLLCVALCTEQRTAWRREQEGLRNECNQLRAVVRRGFSRLGHGRERQQTRLILLHCQHAAGR